LRERERARGGEEIEREERRVREGEEGREDEGRKLDDWAGGGGSPTSVTNHL
jgi:hypothetical protein